MPESNYFTCTLGEALRLRSGDNLTSPSFGSIVELIDHQAHERPNQIAIGFPELAAHTSETSKRNTLTFRELQHTSVSAANELSITLNISGSDNSGTTVGLICKSGLPFIQALLGLVRLSCPVLLLAPNLDLIGLKHLCSSLEVRTVICDGRYSLGLIGGIRCLSITALASDHAERGLTPSTANGSFGAYAGIHKDRVAYYHHTSGTSSGLPKPIPQTEHGVVGALPRFTSLDQPCTFSTTPLYHGGLADCFRAWTSGAAVWFYPEGRAAITARSILDSIAFARLHSDDSIGYFSSVPYVLQMLMECEEGMQTLQKMDIVGVGGAAFPGLLGNKLVEQGVRLVSRYGSAECGFLLSSHRDYAAEKDWQFLRQNLDDPTVLAFERGADGLSELIAMPEWPFKAKTNRADGSYATSDLFEVHPRHPNRWRYHSRADAQIVLSTGKKFDPSPIEAGILVATNLLQDVLIFGSGQSHVGMLLFPLDPENTLGLINEIWPVVERSNQQRQSHSRILKSMLVVVNSTEGQAKLPKSSKGTTLRPQAAKMYAELLKRAYEETSVVLMSSSMSDADVQSSLLSAFENILGRSVDVHRDLYSQGVDSIACVAIRKRIMAGLPSTPKTTLPMNVIYDQATVAGLVVYLRGVLEGRDLTAIQDSETELMLSLVDKYSRFDLYVQNTEKPSGRSILLTGATGFLGAHILSTLCEEATADVIFCLVRASSCIEAQQRVSRAFAKYLLPEISTDQNSRIEYLRCDLSQDDLGLSPDDLQRISRSTSMVFHAAWSVNFTLRLSSFENNIAGTRSLVNFSMRANARFIFISSIAAVQASIAETIREDASHNSSDASPLGYSRSKWVAEQICLSASQQPSLEGSISIIRVGQLCSNRHGAWNRAEAYPSILSTAKAVGCLPDLDEALNWLPVDIAAKAIIEITAATERPTKRRTPVYHVLNTSETPTWRGMLRCIKKSQSSPDFNIVRPAKWVKALEESDDDESRALLSFWKDTYTGEMNTRMNRPRKGQVKFDTAEAQKASAALRQVAPLDEKFILRVWNWVNTAHHV